MYPPKLQKILDDFATLADDEKYEELMSYGDELEEIPSELRQNKYLVPGCMSQVYIYTTVENEKVHIQGWADSFLLQGLIRIFQLSFNDCSPQELIKTSNDFLLVLGSKTITPSRMNGSLSIFEMIKRQVKDGYTKKD